MEFFVHSPRDSSGDGLKDTQRAGPTQKICVPATTLDAYVAQKEIERLDLIKIDTEGAELHVVRGAVRDA